MHDLFRSWRAARTESFRPTIIPIDLSVSVLTSLHRPGVCNGDDIGVQNLRQSQGSVSGQMSETKCRRH